MLLLKLLLLPFRIIWAVVKLAIKIILLPLKLVTGCLLPIVILLILVAVAAYFIYHWLT
jgi:hypothetical protein